MPTIKDIAKLAGVSQGTVSNVLNNKGNVSSKKIKQVLDAANTLGYIPNTRAKILRAGKTNILALIMPNISSKHYIDFYLSFKYYAESHGYSVRVYLTNDRPETELSILSRVKSIMTEGIVVISCLTDDSKAYKDLNNYKNSTIIFIERKNDLKKNFIGFDYREAGAFLAKQAIINQYTNIGLVTGNLKLSNEAEFYNGFTQTMDKTKCNIHHIQTDQYRKNQNIMQMLNSAPLEAVFVSNYSFAENVKDICKNFYNTDTLNIYTVSPLFTMPESDFYKFELNYRLLGNTAAESLISLIDNKTDDKIDKKSDKKKGKKLETQVEKKSNKLYKIIESDGHRNWFPNINTKSKTDHLNVLTLDSPEAYTLKNLSRIYTQKTGIRINTTVYSYDEMYDAFMNMEDDSAFDIIRLDVTWLSWFAEKILMPIEDIDPDIHTHFGQLIDGLAEPYSLVNNKVYALPSTPSMQLLFYREDLFNDTILQRLYYERYKKELLPPTSFADFNQIAEFFTKAHNPSSPVNYGATLTLGSTGVAGSEFLARFFSYNKNLYDQDGKVRLNSDIGLQSLEQLIEIKKYSAKDYNSWWTNTAESFASGDTAMTILYSNYASDLLKDTSNIVSNIGYCLVPGDNPVIGGGSLGVSKHCQHPEDALEFIKWISSEPISSASTLLGSVSACKGTYDNYEIVDTFPWLNLVKDSFVLSQGKRLPSSTHLPFDERRFLNIIGMAVKNSYSGARQAKEALDIAQEMFEREFGNLY